MLSSLTTRSEAIEAVSLESPTNEKRRERQPGPQGVFDVSGR
jgi:hypothetical protein